MPRPDPRDHHYVFAHVALRSMAFRDPAQVFAVLERDGAQFLQWVWGRVGKELLGQGVEALAFTFSAPLKGEVAGAPALVVPMPVPKAPSECWFVALVLEGASLKYYTLELGSTQGGGERTVLCDWTADGTHRNFGDGPAPSPEAFLQAIADVRAKRTLH